MSTELQNRKAFQYFAFISYSRADKKLAEWLQRKLEWYRIPSGINLPHDLAGKAKWIRPVFRDQTDLSVQDDSFWCDIEKKLNQSHYLLVLCSPTAATSKNVDREINLFLKTDASRVKHMLPIIIRGKVNATNPSEECFPLTLRKLGSHLFERNLPSLIDVSREAFFLQVVSFLLCVDYSVINNRYQNRKRKQLFRLAITGLTSAIVFALISTVAVLQCKVDFTSNMCHYSHNTKGVSMKKLLMIAVMASISFAMGCSSAGPYVTNIMPDGRGNLIIEREQLRFTPLLGPCIPIGRISSRPLAPITIRITPEAK